MKPICIGIAGQKQNGKDTLADYIFGQLKKCEEFKLNFERAAFAFNVKKVFSETFDVSYEFIEDWKVKSEPPPGFDITVREALQFIGDGFRKIKSSIWIDLMFRYNENKIISDVRYLNEAHRIVEEGGFNILIAHPDRVNDDPNGSEAQIRPYAVWCLENMSTSGFITNTASVNKPEHMDLFTCFVRNDKSIDDLYEITDEIIVPFIKLKIKEISNEI